MAERILSGLPRLLRQLDDAMSPAIAAAQSLRRGATAAPVNAALTRAAALDFTGVAIELAELKQLLLRRSLKARKLFEALEARLANTPEGVRLEPVRGALAALDYASALRYLDELPTPTVPVEESMS